MLHPNEVITTWDRFRSDTAFDTLCGSLESGGFGVLLFWIAQKLHLLVQTSPKIKKVAVFALKQSEILGQRASSQTVASPAFLRSTFTACLSDNLPGMHKRLADQFIRFIRHFQNPKLSFHSSCILEFCCKNHIDGNACFLLPHLQRQPGICST